MKYVVFGLLGALAGVGVWGVMHIEVKTASQSKLSFL